ncbi:MAG: hypothetical protein LBE22_05900 [Azoarcus sp.]|jgi:hypothetical protein|nr:hypothetical protein [Azoarcus sp.]
MANYQHIKNLLQARPKIVASVIGGALIGTVGLASSAGLEFFGIGGSSSSVSNISSTADSSLLVADQVSKNAARLNNLSKDCADNGLGKNIKEAQKIHEMLAWAQPNTEKLFNVSQACFANISQIWDLSSAIPSLSSIMSSAISAVQQYAQQKVCTAVNEVSTMVAQPINQAMGQVQSTYSGLTGGGLISSAMSEIDPKLGNMFQVSSGNTTVTLGNGFNAEQSTFNKGTNDRGSGSNNMLNQSANSIDEIFNSQVNLTNQLHSLNTQLNQAQQQYNLCLGSGGACDQQQQQVTNIQSSITNTQNALQNLGQQLNEVSQNTPHNSFTPSSSPNRSAPNPSTAPGSDSSSSSYTDRLKGIFN